MTADLTAAREPDTTDFTTDVIRDLISSELDWTSMDQFEEWLESIRQQTRAQVSVEIEARKSRVTDQFSEGYQAALTFAARLARGGGQ